MTIIRDAVSRWWFPASVGARMVVVILMSVLPLGAIASTLALRDYQTSFGQGTSRTEAMLLAFVARQQEALRETTAGLHALGGLPGLRSPASCPSLSAMAVRLSAGRILGLVVRSSGPGQALVCAAGEALPLSIALSTTQAMTRGGARSTAGVTLGRLDRTDRSIPAIPLRVAVAGSGGAPGLTLDALVAIERDVIPAGAGEGGAIWLVRDGHPELLLGNAAIRPPGTTALQRLVKRGRPTFANDDASGRTDAYAIGRLPEGSVVVAGDQATGEEERAALLLFRRVLAIAALLLLGLLVVMVGAHVTVSAPVLALTRRVDRWREGGIFDRANMRFMPAELVALASVFEHAVSAIAERERQLERASADQELLIKEIHHRVKNNLQIIASLLNLQANRIRAPEAKAEFGAARDRVRALATLHRHLYAEGGLHTIAMRPFLLELCGQLFQAMGEREGARIRLDVDAPDLDMSSDQAVPLALIVTEAVSNAVKYAFPGGRSGHVSVCLQRGPDETIDLLIEDDGVGIPAGRIETETGIRDGLGIQLIRGFARQLGATLTVTEENGTRYHLVLALRPPERDGVLPSAA